MNKYITKEAERVLKGLVESEDQELTWERRGGWWIEHHRVSARACKLLLQLCLLRVSYDDGKDTYSIYEPSSEAKRVLAEDDYKPAILIAMETGEPQFPRP